MSMLKNLLHDYYLEKSFNISYAYTLISYAALPRCVEVCSN